ncbi:hypothetical protein CH263_11495 [Rhodococcus sp. 06-1059B-a]|nr:IS110 family transposase [Rhodococcus sp. 06-1059B-a]OZD67252.1 hypothetical protein CH263_11495 [Rhodococcus sp. 06-1059B-a]
MTENPPDVSLTVFVGIDTHKDTHHAAVIDHLGRDVADRQFPATAAGYRAVLAWLAGIGVVARVGVEGTGSYGSGVTAVLQQAGIDVVDVDRTARRSRRFHGKSDPLDAYSAARLAASGIARTIPKAHNGDVEAIRFLHNARRSAVKSRAEAITALKSAVVNAPEAIREQLRDLSTTAVKTALRSLARRIRMLDEEITALEADLHPLIDDAAKDLLERYGVGYETAAQLLITIGDNHERISTEAAFANLCGVAPIPASSGKTNRNRLNRGGNRQANRALHIIVVARLKRDPRTQAYRDKRLTEGKSKRDIIRCLKRAVAREMFKLLTRKITG